MKIAPTPIQREWHKITNTKGRFTSDYKIVFKDSMSLITFNNILGNWGLMKGVVHWEQEAHEELKKEACVSAESNIEVMRIKEMIIH